MAFNPVSLLDSYEQQGQVLEQQKAQALQRQVQELGLREKLQAAAKARMYEAEVAKLGPSPSQEQLVALASRFGGPEAVMKAHQTSLDKQTALTAQQDAASGRADLQRELAASRAEQATRAEQMTHEFRMSRIAGEQERAAETARHNKALEVLAQNRPSQERLVPVKEPDGRIVYLPQSQASGREVGGRVTDVNLPKQVQQLGRDFEKAGLPQMIPVVERAMQITPEQAAFITGPGAMLPDRAVPQDIREARQALQKLFNITLRDRSGAAVTYQELERLKTEFGQGLIKEPKQLLAAIRDARGIVESHYTGVGASYGKDVLDAYNANLEAIGGAPFRVTGQGGRLTPTQPGAPQPASGGIPTVTNDAEYNALPAGTEYVGPDGKKRRKR